MECLDSGSMQYFVCIVDQIEVGFLVKEIVCKLPDL